MLVGALAAQVPPGAPMPADLTAVQATPPAASPADVRWQLAKAAMTAGRAEEAREHLAAALEYHAASPALLFDMVAACTGDRDGLLRWIERFARATADAQGRVKAAPRKGVQVPREIAAALDDVAKLEVARAQALAEAARLAERHRAGAKGNVARALLVRWASELALEAGHGAPAMLGAVAPAIAKVADGFAPDYDAVWQGLLRILRQRAAAAADAPTTGPSMQPGAVEERATRAARILAGLARQAGFRDLKGPKPPDVEALGDEAREWLDERRRAQAASTKVWTIAELEAMDAAAAQAFTAAHDTWSRPGTAASVTGKYRIETICGHGTLLGVARTIEHHHARLVAHYGMDPFAERQGVVRIEPEHGGLEAQGAPYWWAGGFQAGDVTVVRFAWGDVVSLGRTLTHELTHRFDGVLLPFLPPWFGEGHADWTSGHYGAVTDTTTAEDCLRKHTAAHTYYKGYGGRENLEKLLRGDLDDYRDNYFAGYSLYTFLRTFPPRQAPLYRDALARWQKNARGGQSKPLEYFVSCFCDGKQGRPATLDAFVEQWNGFLRDCYELGENEKPGNVARLYPDPPPGERGRMVHDAPTYSWARHRAEPFFGQDHAAAAVRLLHEVGDAPATLAAGLWSLTVDGWRAETVEAMLAALRKTGAADAEHALAAVAQARFPDVRVASAAPLAAQAKAAAAFAAALAARATALHDTAPVAAAALRAEHARLARLLGLEEPMPPGNAAAVPPPAPAWHLASHGLAESSLTGYDDRRVAGLWYATPEGDLHVGRERPRDGTGTMDREAHQRDAFVHSVAWLAPGRYEVRGRVHFTTSYVAGAIVFGHTRRDRDLRLSFSSGDFRYATGRDATGEGHRRVSLDLNGLWERDRHLTTETPSWTVELDPQQPWFDFVIEVHGPRVRVRVNGEEPLTYGVHDGAPVEGVFGFATSMGAVRVQQPTVRRLDGVDGITRGLDVRRPETRALEELLLLPTRGIPRSPAGTLVLWLAPMADGTPLDRLPRALAEIDKLLTATHEFPQPWVVAVPESLTAGERRQLESVLAERRREPPALVEHCVAEPFVGSYPWVLFVDALGVLRAAAEITDTDVHTRVARWARLFRPR